MKPLKQSSREPGSEVTETFSHIWIKLDSTCYCFLMRNLLSKNF